MGVFRYVKFKRLLEAEVGYTFNEPTDLAITEAIEKAVHSLIIEGIIDQMWSLKDQSDIEDEQVQGYLEEKEKNLNIDMFGIPYNQKLRSRFYSSFSGTGQLYSGDYSSGEMLPGLKANLGIGLSKSFFLNTGIGMQRIQILNLYDSYQYSLDLNIEYLANQHGRFSPLLSFGGGGLYNFEKDVGISNNTLFMID